jgi:hypothetical protein
MLVINICLPKDELQVRSFVQENTLGVSLSGMQNIIMRAFVSTNRHTSSQQAPCLSGG